VLSVELGIAFVCDVLYRLLPVDNSLLYSVCAVLFDFSLAYATQVLLSTDSSSPAPFFPYGIWVMALLGLSLVGITLFQGKYFRLEHDSGRN